MKEEKLNELHIAINSKCEEINKLVGEYDELGGTVNYINLLNFGDNKIRSSIVGMSNDIGSMLLSEEELMMAVASRIGNAINSEE